MNMASARFNKHKQKITSTKYYSQMHFKSFDFLQVKHYLQFLAQCNNVHINEQCLLYKIVQNQRSQKQTIFNELKFNFKFEGQIL